MPISNYQLRYFRMNALMDRATYFFCRLNLIATRSCYFISAAFPAAASCVKLHSSFSQVLAQIGFGRLAIEASYGYFAAYFLGGNCWRGRVDDTSPSG